MNYLENHLPKGEKIIAKTRKSAFIFTRDVVIALLLVGGALGVQFGAHVDIKIMMWVYVAVALVVLLFFSNSLVKFASTLMVVTTHKFMYKEDIITIKVFDTQLTNIDGIEVEYKTPLRRLLNVGTIIIRTRNSVHEFRNIARPDKFTAILNKQAADVCDRRSSAVHVSFGIGRPAVVAKQPEVSEKGEKVKGEKIKGEAKPVVNN